MPLNPTIIPQKQYVQHGDITPTDVRDKGLGQMLGLDNYRGNAIQKCLGFSKNVHNLAKRLTKPMQNLAKLAFNPVGSLIKHIFNVTEAVSRKELSPPFKDAGELLNTGEGIIKLEKFARDAKLCGGGLAGTCAHLGSPHPPDNPGKMLSYDEYIEDLKSKSPDQQLSFNDDTLTQYYDSYKADHTKKETLYNNFVKKDPGELLTFDEFLVKYKVPSSVPKKDATKSYEMYKKNHAKETKTYSDFLTKQASYEKSNQIFNQLPEHLKLNIEKNNGMFIDKNTGLAMMFAVDSKPGNDGKPTIHLQFLGTGAGSSEEGNWVMAEHVSTDIAMSGLTYSMPSNFKQGSEIAALFKEKFGSEYNIECKGHSMGGALATYIGIKNNLKVTTTSTAPLSPQLQKDLGYDAMKHAVDTDQITHLSVKGDWLTDNSRLARGVAKGFEYLTGKNTSHIIGSGYRINERFAGYNYGGNAIHAVLLGFTQKGQDAMHIHNSAANIWNTFAERSMNDIPEIGPDHSSII